MASDRRIYVTLAFASAVLAAFVPGVLDAQPLATSGPAPVPQPVPVVQSSVIVSPPAPAVSPGRPEAVDVSVRRTRIPVGCERVVSPLVRSAAASQLSRCVT